MTTLCKVQLAAARTHAQVCPCLRVGMRVSPDTSSVSSLDNVHLPCVAPGLSSGKSTVRAIEQSTLNGISHKRSHQGCAQTISVTTQATWVTSLLSVMLSSTLPPGFCASFRSFIHSAPLGISCLSVEARCREPREPHTASFWELHSGVS